MTMSQRELRVLHVTEASLGGLRRHMADLIIGLQQLGVTQAIAFSRVRADSGMLALEEWCESHGVDVFELAMLRRIAPLADAKAALELRSMIRQWQPHVLHLHSSKAGGIGRLVAIGFPGLRVIYTPNGLASHLSPAYGVVERVLGRLRTDRLIAVSESERAEIVAAGIVPQDVVVTIPSGIDVNEVKRAAETDEFPTPAPRSVVVVGRLAEQKDPLFVADCSALVLREIRDARFVWVGDGELRESFLSRLDELGVRDSWTLTGWVDNPYKYMGNATICALASRYESFGYVTLEAMALGRPVVATSVAGSADLVVNGVTGKLVPPGDAAAFGAALIDLLQDQNEANALGVAAESRAFRFTREQMASNTLALYRKLTA